MDLSTSDHDDCPDDLWLDQILEESRRLLKDKDSVLLHVLCDHVPADERVLAPQLHRLLSSSLVFAMDLLSDFQLSHRLLRHSRGR